MKNQLTSRVLDIVVTRVAPKTVFYNLAANGASGKWRIPTESKFNKQQLLAGDRYIVTTRVIQSLQWNFTSNNFCYRPTYDWVTAERTHAALRKEECPRWVRLRLPFADDGTLFNWRRHS